MLRVVLFDLDGTLIDSYMDIGIHLNNTLRYFGLKEVDIQSVKYMVGGGARELLKRFFQERLEEALIVFRESYMKEPVIYTKVFDGVPYVLEKLKGMGLYLGIVTNKMEVLTKKILQKLDIAHYFDIVIGGDTYSEKKPSPLPILKAMEFFKESPDKTLMVGDTETDLIAGKKANVKTALASWGYVGQNGTIPDYYLRAPIELVELVKLA